MKRKHRMPRAAVHLGKAKDIGGGEAMADAMTLATYGAAVRAEERRDRLAVPESTYWPCAPFSISLEELDLLLRHLPVAKTPTRLLPLREELEECYRLGSVGAGA